MSAPLRAGRQEVARPRPTLLREHWAPLDGEWGFAHDDAEVGERESWFDPGHRLDRTIVVPFPPESAASGVADDRFHDVVWYQRTIAWDTVLEAGYGEERPRLHLRFGAVDYRARVWVNGRFVGEHEGGHTPFAFDIADALRPGREQHVVVRAEDRAADVEQPRGKQDWQEDAHVIWYRRTTGIWQPVWLEATPATFVEQLQFSTDLPRGAVAYEIRLNRPPAPGTRCRVELFDGDERIAATTTAVSAQRHTGTVTIPRLLNGQDREGILWTPESPRLIDVGVVLEGADEGEDEPGPIDAVAGYLGLRTTGVRDGHFVLNGLPRDLRSVLSQGYWPQSHLAAPSEAALREEVELILSLGFDAARVHQKIEDPRFLYWADRLGLLLWGEAPAAYRFSPTAVERLTREWLEALDRDRSHPSIVTWVPMNESWGIQDVAADPAQQAFARALVQLTRAIDPTRPVISNDGWEHLESDILSVHDYDHDPDTVRDRYRDAAAAAALRTGVGPAGRAMVLTDAFDPSAPLMLTEFGGVEFQPDRTNAPDDSWGYSTATTAEQFEGALRGLYGALRSSTVLAGTCYTQLTDTMQEANGLLTEDRRPKLPVAVIRSIVTGREEAGGA
ncbi:glycoside hydrolase family 2 protein [Leifsonia aquatica]|uniref:glycoside hydrolase family 2 protein n=1 Tax=Leifsonia aquatica TaxID=144185 RepID=UPI000AE491EA|nr:sugar-binding domain-containing protein [Leifsonia aquatica]